MSSVHRKSTAVRLGRGDALIIVGVQNDFLPGDSPAASRYIAAMMPADACAGTS